MDTKDLKDIHVFNVACDCDGVLVCLSVCVCLYVSVLLEHVQNVRPVCPLNCDT